MSGGTPTNVQHLPDPNPRLIESIEATYGRLDSAHGALAVTRQSLSALRAAVVGDD